MMPEPKLVLVTGGGGFIGSHCIVELLNSGYKVVALDNFANAAKAANGKPESLNRAEKLTGKTVAFHEVDVTNRTALSELFTKYKFDAVLHLAGLKAVGESVEKPLLYYDNNMIGTIILLECMKEAGVRNFIFSSSATVYGPAQKLPMGEDHPVGQGLTNTYGQTKFMLERVCFDLVKAEPGWNVVVLRYFNPVGGHASGTMGEHPKGVPNNLMPFVAQVAVGRLPAVKVFGNDYDTPDGTGVRDYIHVVDLAKGHVSAMKKVEEGSIGCKVYNLGTGRGYSVLEMIAALEKACGHKIPYEIAPRREGDLASVYCDPSLAAKEMNWKAELGLEEMCRDLWNWQKNNPNGYD